MTDIHEQREQTRTKKEPTRHAKIMRGVVTPIFGLLAVACIVFGILNQTIWQPNPQITATAPVRNTQYLLIDQAWPIWSTRTFELKPRARAPPPTTACAWRSHRPRMRLVGWRGSHTNASPDFQLVHTVLRRTGCTRRGEHLRRRRRLQGFEYVERGQLRCRQGIARPQECLRHRCGARGLRSEGFRWLA